MASFTATAISGKFSADHTAFVCGFDLSHASVPAAFWTNVDAGGGNIRVFESGPARVAAHVNRFDKDNETGWLWFRADVLTGSDNVFTVDTNGTAQAPGDTYGRNNVWQDYQAVYFLGDGGFEDYTGNGQNLTVARMPPLFELISTGPSIVSHQGIAFDGTHYYAFHDNAIRKFDQSWNQVEINSDPAGDAVPGSSTIGGGVEVDGKLYVTVGGAGGVQTQLGVYLASDLSFVESFTIGPDASGAADWTYNPADGLLYTIRFDTGGATVLRKYDPVDGSAQGTITLSSAISHAQGILLFRGAFYVCRGGSDDSLYRVEMDGTVSGPVLTRGLLTGNDIQGGDVSPDGSGIIFIRNDGTDDFVEHWAPYDLPLAGGGGARFNDDRLWAALTATSNVFTLSAMVQLDNTSDFRTQALTAETLSSTSSRAMISTRNNATWQCFDTQNGSFSATALAIDTPYRVHVQWDGTTAKRLFVNGVLEEEDLGISAIGATHDVIVLGDSNDGAAGTAEHVGFEGFVVLRYDAPSTAWFADEHSMLDDSAAFWTVGSAGATPPSTPKVGVKGRRSDSVDAWMTDFVPGEEGDTHGASQWEITTDDDPTFANPIWQSGDDTEHLTIYNRAGKEVPLPTDTALRLRGRQKGLPSGLYSEWSSEGGGDQEDGVETGTTTSPRKLFQRPMQLRPHWMERLDQGEPSG